MGPDLWWFGRKLMRNCAGYAGFLLIIAGIVVLMAFSPVLIDTASANSRTADPTPNHRLTPWTGDPQAFANAARASLDEVWRILASYSHGMASQAEFPHIVVTKTAVRTDCALGNPTSPNYFNPSRDFADFCKNGKAVYLSHPQTTAFAAKFGPYRLLALMAGHIASIKAEHRSNIEGFTACVVGAWLGYLHNKLWQLIEEQAVDQAQAYFSDGREEWFLRGYDKRSLDPCLAI